MEVRFEGRSDLGASPMEEHALVDVGDTQRLARLLRRTSDHVAEGYDGSLRRWQVRDGVEDELRRLGRSSACSGHGSGAIAQ